MLALIAVGVLAGIITSVSPCVLPVLPVVLAAGGGRGPAHAKRTRSWRPYGVVVGLVISFCTSTLAGSLLLSAVGLPQDLLRDMGIAVLALVGLGMIWRRFGELVERPFARLRGRQVNPDGNGLGVGLGVGLLFVPCAGPVLATIAVVGATHRIGLSAVVLTAAFGVGIAVPLLLLALARDTVAQRTRILRRRARELRTASGLVMIAIAAALAFNLTDGLQQLVPGYTTALQSAVESSPTVNQQLHDLTTGQAGPTPVVPPVAIAPTAENAPCQQDGPTLENCGPAPAFTGIDAWLNTPGNQPLDLAALRGKVVLLDFWTYSCINCQRSLPHLEALSRTYAAAGLVVVGVHTPEFAFEHVTRNVAAQAEALGVRYPIAIDNHYATWNAYANEYWPAEYLVDAAGAIRHSHIGEGDYAGTERLVRQLLTAARPGQALPAPTDAVDTATPTFFRTPETYLGYRYRQSISGTVPTRDRSRTYRFPAVLTPDTFALSGTWRAGPEALTATGRDARLELSYRADTAYLVLGGSGTVSTEIGGVTSTFAVAGPPRLYTLSSGRGDSRTILTLTATPGVAAYDFTFG
jgi:cytochrome c biogenesis protein CcdA/thiol-disulfide isomerase/thioredoxin